MTKPRPARAASRRPAARAPSAPRLHASGAIGDREARLLERSSWVVLAVLAGALIAMIVGPHRIGDYWAESDFYGGYVEGAKGIARGVLDPSRYGVVGPVYEIALAAVGSLVPDWFLAGQLLSVAAAVATGLLWFVLLSRRGSLRWGFVALLFLCANPYFFRYGYAASTDALAMALQALALCLLFAARAASAPLWSGVAAGLAFLTRYNGIYLVPASLLALAFDGERARRRRDAGLLLLGFAVPVGAWLLYSMSRGTAPSFQLHHIIAYETFARPQGLTWDDYQERLQPLFRNLGDVIARSPGEVVSRLAFNAVDHLRLDAALVLGWPVALAAVAGLALAAADRAMRTLWPIAAGGALLFLTLVPIAHGGRYSLPLVPVYCALAAAAFASPRFALPIRPGVWVRTALLPLVLGASVAASVRLQAHDMGQLPTDVLEAAGPLRRLAAPDDRIVARKPHIAYYGGVRALPFPFATDLVGLASYAHRERARWLFFSVYEARMRPELAHLLDTTGVVPGLAVRAVTTSHPAVLYEIGPAFGTPPAWFGNDTLRTVHAARARLLVEPGNALALRTLGAFAMLRGDREEALRWLRLAAAADPADGETRRLLEVVER